MKQRRKIVPKSHALPSFVAQREVVGTVREVWKKTIICKHTRKLRSESSEVLKRDLLVTKIALQN